MKKIVLIFSLSVLFIAQNIISMVEDDLMEVDIPLEFVDATQESLALAIEEDDADAIFAAIEGGADINAPIAHGVLPFMYAMDGDHEEAQKTLLNAGVNPNAVTPGEGISLLNLAINNLNIVAVRLLVEFGADVSLADAQGTIPLINAQTAYYEIVDADVVEEGLYRETVYTIFDLVSAAARH